jgi:hypothetical protein
MRSRTTMDGDTGATVAAHDIARLANVGRAAVSNWRRRFPDFPEPVGGSSASPLYSLAEVEAWLTRHGKPFTLLPGDRVWQQVRGAVDDLTLGNLVSAIGAFLVFLRREPDGWKRLAGEPDEVVAERLPELMAPVLPDLPGASTIRLDERWIGIVRRVAEAAEEQGDRELFEFLCDRYLQVHSRRYAAVTPAPLAGLMVELADVRGAVVLDPACGIGTLLMAAHAAGAARLGGQELDLVSAQLAAARTLLHDTVVRVVAGDSLRADAFAGELADVVLCDPPFNDRSWGYDELVSDPRWTHGLPPRGEPELAWAQHCLARVRPGGWVLLMMPASVANRRAGRRIRGNLLRTGALRAVISLPGGTTGTVPPDLWILRRPESTDVPPSRILLVDATADLSVAGEAWRSFLATGPNGDGRGGKLAPSSRAVRVIDLLDDEVDLSPARQLHTVGTDPRTGELEPIRLELLSSLAALPGMLPELAVGNRAEMSTSTTVGELVRAGVVAVHQAPLRTTVSEGELPLLTAQDVLVGRPPSGRTTNVPGMVTVEAGDVVVPVALREPVARVVTEAGSVLGPQLLLFRVDQERMDPHFLAGLFRAFQHQAAGVRSASLLARTDIRRTPVPRLSLAEQRRYGEAFRRLVAFADTIRSAASLAETLICLSFNGLADGSIQPSSTAD